MVSESHEWSSPGIHLSKTVSVLCCCADISFKSIHLSCWVKFPGIHLSKTVSVLCCRADMLCKTRRGQSSDCFPLWELVKIQPSVLCCHADMLCKQREINQVICFPPWELVKIWSCVLCCRADMLCKQGRSINQKVSDVISQHEVREYSAICAVLPCWCIFSKHSTTMLSESSPGIHLSKTVSVLCCRAGSRSSPSKIETHIQSWNEVLKQKNHFSLCYGAERLHKPTNGIRRLFLMVYPPPPPNENKCHCAVLLCCYISQSISAPCW